MSGDTDFINRQSAQEKKLKEHILIDNFEGENVEIFEIKMKWSEMRERFGRSDSQMWALFTVTAGCVTTDILGYPRLRRLKLSLI